MLCFVLIGTGGKLCNKHKQVPLKAKLTLAFNHISHWWSVQCSGGTTFHALPMKNQIVSRWQEQVCALCQRCRIFYFRWKERKRNCCFWKYLKASFFRKEIFLWIYSSRILIESQNLGVGRQRTRSSSTPLVGCTTLLLKKFLRLSKQILPSCNSQSLPLVVSCDTTKVSVITFTFRIIESQNQSGWRRPYYPPHQIIHSSLKLSSRALSNLLSFCLCYFFTSSGNWEPNQTLLQLSLPIIRSESRAREEDISLPQSHVTLWGYVHIKTNEGSGML